jgi:hypothetical protein
MKKEDRAGDDIFLRHLNDRRNRRQEMMSWYFA